MNLFTKQPADQLDYDLDFSDWMTDGDTITGAVAVSSVPTEMEILSVTVTDQIVKVWAAGGETGSTYQVTTTVTTNEGRIKEIDFKIRVKEI